MELERNCVELQSVMENLSLENQNLDQERNNLIEQMKNIKSAVSVKIQTEMAESERLRNVLLQTTEENEVLRNQIQEFDQQLKHNVQYDNQLDKEKDTHLNHLQTRIEQLTEQNQKSDIELQRLRNYLIEVEDNFTQDSLALQSTIEEYKKQVIEFENERDEWQQLINQDNDQRESEQELILEMKSDLSKQLSIIEGLKTKSQQDQLSIQNLQQVLSQFESSKQMEIEETVLLLQKNINELQQKSNEFENLYNNAMIQLKEYQENLQSNLKTNIEIELKEKNEIIGQLRHDVIQLQSHLSEAMRRMRSTTSEDSVDK
ncbi:hypothetical protein BC833DRAFT_607069 [Globomyces pollinis-pini]|nr:hypothetical protein BC833DRAFT_607069 [Globomyces pollinis-pini]